LLSARDGVADDFARFKIYGNKVLALRKKIHRWLRWASFALLALIAIDGYRLWRAERMNAAIADGSILNSKETLAPEALFAQAYLHAQKGHHDEATALYKRVETSSSKSLQLASRYNRGNRYLTQAMELDDEATKQLGLPLVEMAKDIYRSVLRAEPSAWDAKYNLERALRLVPDPDDSDDEDLPPPQQSERALTTMRGFTLGLP
jgi:mxaK protein